VISLPSSILVAIFSQACLLCGAIALCRQFVSTVLYYDIIRRTVSSHSTMLPAPYTRPTFLLSPYMTNLKIVSGHKEQGSKDTLRRKIWSNMSDFTILFSVWIHKYLNVFLSNAVAYHSHRERGTHLHSSFQKHHSILRHTRFSSCCNNYMYNFLLYWGLMVYT